MPYTAFHEKFPEIAEKESITKEKLYLYLGSRYDAFWRSKFRLV